MPLLVSFSAPPWWAATTAAPARRSAAKQLASAVAALDVGSVAFDGKDSGAANEQLKDVFKALEPDKPTVEAGELTLDGRHGHGAAELHAGISAPSEWKYTVSAAAQEVRRQVADGVEPRTARTRTGRRRNPQHGTADSPQRAAILGAGDVPLVTYRPVVNVGIDKPQLGCRRRAAIRHPARPAGGR